MSDLHSEIFNQSVWDACDVVDPQCPISKRRASIRMHQYFMTQMHGEPDIFLKANQAKSVARYDSMESRPDGVYPTAVGARQFIEFESTGKYPQSADDYFLHLLSCKRGFHMAVNEMVEGYIAGDDRWPGWAQLHETETKNSSVLRGVRDALGVSN